MSFPAICPKCNTSTLGADIFWRCDLTWQEFTNAIGSPNMPRGVIPPSDTFYGVAAKCPGCGSNIADFLLANSQVAEQMLDFNRKRTLYENGEAIISEMCKITSANVTFVKGE